MTRRRRIYTPLLLLAALAPLPLAAEPGRAPHRDPAALDDLIAATGGKANVRVDEATGTVSFVQLPGGGAPASGLRSRSAGATVGRADVPGARGKSMAFLQSHGRAFGLRNAEAELQVADEALDQQGGAHLTYHQVYAGVPVFGAMVKTHFDAAGTLRAVNGTVVPDIAVDPNPRLQAAAAGAVALRSAEGEGKGQYVGTSRLLVFRSGLVQGVPGENHLAYEIEVTNGFDKREHVYVDAHTGKVIDRIQGIHDGMFRRAYNGLNLNGIPPSYPASPFWVEGDAFPTSSAEADNMLISSQETYDFFFKAFGRDSYNGAGIRMDQIFNRGYSCPNASWNGSFISFCPGLTTDDVTAHEWGHAYTQFTHGLIYQWQSGALNEAYSDMWGETVDRINGRGTDIHVPRTEGVCSTFQPFQAVVRVNSPALGDFAAGTASFGPMVVFPGVTGNVVQALDGANAAGPLTTDACSPLTNAAAVAGNIAILDRGTCAFTIKVKNAQNAGAIGVIVADNAPGLAGMSGVDPTIVIPSLRITQANGNAIKAQLGGGVNASLTTAKPAVTDDSTSWLVGEDDTAAGLFGALRDMWDPTCLGNPGKVTDAEYWCTTGDNGGVHINSGIPNHAFALLVDGGTYEGHTVGQIGLTKTNHIYWRAATVYQTPATDFIDHAIAVEQSCADLIGATLTDLLTGAPSSEVITANDCDQVAIAMEAVEMRTPPTQCGFVPLLNPNTPGRCAAGTEVRVYEQDFEGGPADWTASHTASTPFFTPRDWEWSDNLPTRREGAALFGPNPNIGLCTATSNETGVLHLESPTIALPSGALTPLVSFEHWVATEPGFDGGNVQVSVNGGAWQLVAPAQYTFNPPNRTLFTAAQGNSNPMAGQPAFSGVNQGDVDGSWGQSRVNLSSVAGPGDSVRLRFDLGADCGGGRFGWYLDDPVVYTCVSDAAPALSISDASVTEGNSGFKEITFTVSLSAPTSQAVTVHFKAAQGAGNTGTASPGTDYLPVDGDLTFPALTLNIRQTVTVRIQGDTRREGNETFFVDLTLPVNATVGDGRGQGTIVNDD